MDVSVDWSAAPRGVTTVPITVSGAGSTVEVRAVVDNRPLPAGARGFVAANGCVSIEADHYHRSVVETAGPLPYSYLGPPKSTHL